MNGIAILGLNGAGKSTLAHALAKQIGYYELDVEDCYFPEQSKSRKWSLENDDIIETNHLGLLPFSVPRDKEEVQIKIMSKIVTNPKFIISGVTMNWNDEIVSQIGIAFLVITPVEERLKRIQSREEKRFGSRVRVGGDMFIQQLEFKKVVKNKESKTVEVSAERLDCPVIEIDGTLSVSHNIDLIIEKLNYHFDNNI